MRETGRSLLRKLTHLVWRLTPRPLRLRLVGLLEPSFRVTVALIVRNDEGEVLLLRHVFRGSNPWAVPAGFVKHGETPEDAARRELREETRLEADEFSLVTVRNVRPDLMEIALETSSVRGEIELNMEIEESRWVRTDRLPENTHSDSRSLIEEWGGLSGSTAAS
ncbi:MAG: NUDIX domain-containing protein [Acidobacteria bacterium]|nr:NUDIX domain-containing protein [Acidobacteriota bacterium]